MREMDIAASNLMGMAAAPHDVAPLTPYTQLEGR